MIRSPWSKNLDEKLSPTHPLHFLHSFIFGKTMGKVRKRREFELYRNSKIIQQWINKPHFKSKVYEFQYMVINKARILWHLPNHFLEEQGLGNETEVRFTGWREWEKSFILPKNAEFGINAEKVIIAEKLPKTPTCTFKKLYARWTVNLSTIVIWRR